MLDWTSVGELRGRLIAMLERDHLGLVTDLRVSLEGDVVVLGGQVASEGCRADAKRFALSFNGVFKVRNELVVAGFLQPASDPDLDGFFGPPQGPAGAGYRTKSLDGNRRSGGQLGLRPKRYPPRKRSTRGRGVGTEETLVDLVRQPSITASGALRPGGRVEVLIDLSTMSAPGVPAVTISDLPVGWEVIRVSVQLIAPWASAMVAEVPEVTVMSDGGSRPARFACTVSDEYAVGAPAQVQAVFLHGTRICGQVMRDVADDGPAGETVDEGPVVEVAAGTQPSVRVAPEAAGPSLSVSISVIGEGTQIWTWTAAVPGGTAVGTGRIELGADGHAFAEALLRSCPDLAPSGFRRTMDGVGEQLWRRAPADFRTAYASWRRDIGTAFPIQFVTDDPHVPWEMMKPEIPGAAHLFIDHPVARWPLSRAAPLRDGFAGGDLLSFVPSYPPHKALPSALAEGEWIRAHLGGSPMPGRTSAFFEVLDGTHPRPVGTLHFAGHGRVDTGISDGGIEMEDGHVGVSDVDQSRVVLGERCATLMVLNACEAGAGARMLGMNTGWGAAIAARGFGGLIAPLWEVQDDMALAMVQATLPRLLDGSASLGEAVRLARGENCDRSVAAFAYLAHGDVMARFAPRR